MNLTAVTASLGLPPAPTIFAGTEWGATEDALCFPSFGYPDTPLGPPPDPSCIYCPPESALYPFQEEGVAFLLERHIALLCDEMGLGKSIQAIAAMRLLLHRKAVSRCLILCPKSLLFDWYGKFRQWAPDIRTIPVEGPKRRRQWYWQSKAHIHVAGYETWREDLSLQLVDPAAFDLVALDEIQRIKNPETAIHRAVLQLQAPWRWGLSGTPLENRMAELVAIFAYLIPGLLSDKRHSAVAHVRRKIAPYILRRRKADVLRDLPPKEYHTVWIDLTPEQRAAYDAIEQEGIHRLRTAGHSDAPVIALALLTRLKLICNLDEKTGASSKMTYMEKELEPLIKQGEKVLIFSQYPEKSLTPLMPRLQPYGAILFDSSLSEWSRQLVIHRFQQSPMPCVLAMSLKCGGVGITLTRACHVYHFDHWWNPAVAHQAEDRAHRIGQKRPVRVTMLLTKGTIEERIAKMLAEKQELFHQMMDPLTDGDQEERRALAHLTHSELMHLLQAHQ